MRALPVALTVVVLVIAVQSRGSGLDTLERIVARYSTALKFLGDPVAVMEYQKAAVSYFGGSTYRCQSPAQISSEVRKLIQNDPGLGELLWESVEGGRSFAIKTMPAGQQYRIRRAPRLFHALWSEGSTIGCSVSQCEQADPLAPTRWAVVAPGSVWASVERDGEFVGSSVVLVPLSNGIQSLYGVAEVGLALRGMGGWYSLSTPIGSYTGSLVDALAVGARDLGWIDRKAQLAKAMAPRGDLKARLVSIASGAEVNLGELSDWLVADPRALVISRFAHRSCLVSGIRSADVFSAFGDLPLVVDRLQTPSLEGLESGNTVSPASRRPSELVVIEILKSGGAEPGKTSFTPKKIRQYEITLTSALASNMPLLDRARAAYALAVLSTLTPNQATKLSRPDQRSRASAQVDSALSRAMLELPNTAVGAYSALALAKRGNHSVQVGQHMAPFSKSGQSKADALDLNSDRRLPIFDPLIRDLAVAKEQPKYGYSIPNKLAKDVIGRFNESPLGDTETRLIEELSDIYLKNENYDGVTDELAKLAKSDPASARKVVDMINARSSDTCSNPSDQTRESS